MKNVIALGLVACAAFVSVPAQAQGTQEMWEQTCSDQNVAMWDWLDKHNGYKKLSAKYGTPGWGRQRAVREEYVKGCAQHMLNVKFTDESTYEDTNRELFKYHNGVVKSFEAKLKAAE